MVHFQRPFHRARGTYSALEWENPVQELSGNYRMPIRRNALSAVRSKPRGHSKRRGIWEKCKRVNDPLEEWCRRNLWVIGKWKRSLRHPCKSDLTRDCVPNLLRTADSAFHTVSDLVMKLEQETRSYEKQQSTWDEDKEGSWWWNSVR